MITKLKNTYVNKNLVAQLKLITNEKLNINGDNIKNEDYKSKNAIKQYKTITLKDNNKKFADLIKIDNILKPDTEYFIISLNKKI